MKNPLQQYPYLFSNGKFRAKESQFGYTEKIMGVDISNNEIILEAGMHAKMRLCTLIARPISDMSDQEMRGSNIWREITSHDDLYEEKIISIECVDQISVKEFLFYLSIGVYPFDQSHFEDETVIDITKL